MELAWGCKPHTGWAVAVLVSGSPAAPVVLDRRRVLLCPEDLPRQVYHAAQGLPRGRAAALVDEVDAAVARLAGAVAEELAEAALPHGELIGMAVVGRPRDMPDLDAALASHSMLHSAEGELYRGALDDVAGALGLPVVPVAPKRTTEEAAAALGVGREELAARLAALRAELGAPWRADHRDATAAALVALHLGR
jgi:hypothetical protein